MLERWATRLLELIQWVRAVISRRWRSTSGGASDRADRDRTVDDAPDSDLDLSDWEALVRQHAPQLLDRRDSGQVLSLDAAPPTSPPGRRPSWSSWPRQALDWLHQRTALVPPKPGPWPNRARDPARTDPGAASPTRQAPASPRSSRSPEPRFPAEASSWTASPAGSGLSAPAPDARHDDRARRPVVAVRIGPLRLSWVRAGGRRTGSAADEVTDPSGPEEPDGMTGGSRGRAGQGASVVDEAPRRVATPRGAVSAPPRAWLESGGRADWSPPSRADSAHAPRASEEAVAAVASERVRSKRDGSEGGGRPREARSGEALGPSERGAGAAASAGRPARIAPHGREPVEPRFTTTGDPWPSLDPRFRQPAASAHASGPWPTLPPPITTPAPGGEDPERRDRLDDEQWAT